MVYEMRSLKSRSCERANLMKQAVIQGVRTLAYRMRLLTSRFWTRARLAKEAVTVGGEFNEKIVTRLLLHHYERKL